MPDSDLERSVATLHAAQTITIRFERLSNGRTGWDATLSGEDYLDGPWTVHRHGSTRTHRRAASAAIRAFHNEPNRRTP